ncbi:MAG: hypothetical protein KDI19_09485, partial [Pseudomonadales bacterium]|nr:hypothetical protein [Pseudomonadales bacterium]
MRWLALASIAIGLAASAQDLTSSPAHFREGERSLISRLRLPERLADGDYLVRCAGKAMSSGTLRDVTCHRGEPGDFDRLIERIVVATRKTKVTPARYNAKATRVWFDFSVRVIKRGADVQVASYPHHFNNASLYGESYSAPQRVAASTKYIAKCGTIALIMAAASIDADGNAHEATILKSHNEE